MMEIKRRLAGPGPSEYVVGQKVEAELMTVRGEEWLLAIVTSASRACLMIRVVGTGCEIARRKEQVRYKIRPLPKP